MKNKRNKIIAISIVLLMMLMLLLYSIPNKNGILHNLIGRNYKLGESNTSLKLETKDDDNVLLIFENDNGIKQITDSNGDKIYANGKKEVSMDYKVEKNKKYTFEIIDNFNNTSQNSFITPESHIELTKLNFEVDLEQTRKDISSELNNYNIATNFIDLRLGDLDNLASDSVNLQQAVNSWKKIGADTWRVTNDGRIFSSVPGGYTKPNWWGTGLINPNEKANKINKFKMDFTLSQSGQLNEGPCFFVSQNTDGSLNGYFFNVNNHKACYGNPNYYQCRLWKFTHYTLDQSFSAGINDSSHMWCYPVSAGYNVNGTSSYGSDSFTCLAAWNGSLTASYHIEASEGNILIQMNGTTVANVTDTTYLQGTYGFWGNNCEQKDSMYLKDVRINTFVTLTLNELLQDIEWSNTTDNMIVNFNNSNEVSLNDSSTIEKFKKFGIRYIAVSDEENKEDIENFIANIDNKGTYIESTNYDTYIKNISSYLKDCFEANN